MRAHAQGQPRAATDLAVWAIFAAGLALSAVMVARSQVGGDQLNLLAPVWRDFRAPAVVVLAFHVLAFLVLDRSLCRVLSPGERVLLAVFYWLSPWRLYHSGFLWNPNYLLLLR